MVFACFNKPLTGTRFGPPVRVGGRVISLGSETPLAFNGSEQPMTANEMNSLPEGRRTSSTKKLFVDIKLNSIEESNNTNPDRIILVDGTYEVFRVQDWQNGIIPHYVAFVTRINQV